MMMEMSNSSTFLPKIPTLEDNATWMTNVALSYSTLKDKNRIPNRSKIMTSPDWDPFKKAINEIFAESEISDSNKDLIESEVRKIWEATKSEIWTDPEVMEAVAYDYKEMVSQILDSVLRICGTGFQEFFDG